MKKVTFVLLAAALTALMLLPSLALAYENQVEISLQNGSGDYTDIFGGINADVSMGGYGFSYTRYLSDLATTDTPYGVREFLQHPSWVGAMIVGQGMEIEDNLSPSLMELKQGQFILGGQYFMELGGMASGLGVRIENLSQEYDSFGPAFGLDSLETTGTALVFMWDHYIKESISINLEMLTGDYEMKDNLGFTKLDREDRLMTIGASALIQDKIWLSGSLRNGEQDYDFLPSYDINGMHFQFGFYPMQNLGVFFTIDSQTTEVTPLVGVDEVSVEIAGDYYIDENMHVRAGLLSMEEDETFGYNLEAKALNVSFGLGF